MTWDLQRAGSWGVATTDTPADLAAALALPGSWPIGKQPKCFVRRDQWINLLPPPTEPVLNSITPNTGPVAGGTASVLAGAGLTLTTACYYGSSPASFNVIDDNTVNVTSPAKADGNPGNVNVNVIARVGSNPVQFDYQ